VVAFEHDAAVDHVLVLRDGRRLGYAAYGDPDGFPILNCHGGLVCRFDVEPCGDDFRRLGVSVLSPDRPGVGLSDRHPGHSTADWVDDARELVDTLGVDQLAVMGWSLGGQYAAAIAARLGDRVTHAAIIAGCLPLDNDATFAQLNKLDRRLARLSKRFAPVARTVFAASALFARRAPERYGRFEARRSPAADAAVLRANAEWFGRAVGEAGSNSAGMVDEYRAFVSAWGFGFEDIAIPVHVYQGTADELVPPAWASDITNAIPGATLTTFDGEGHFIAISHRADIVRDLLAPTTAG
jgi:pimeloyl-ACP methyl ester carboxylesterase